jgi:hypothetical protein
MADDEIVTQVEQLEAELRRCDAEVTRLEREVESSERLLKVFVAVVVLALGLAFFVIDYRRNDGAGWPWWEKVGGFVVAI